jgi:hypothetical protein
MFRYSKCKKKFGAVKFVNNRNNGVRDQTNKPHKEWFRSFQSQRNSLFILFIGWLRRRGEGRGWCANKKRNKKRMRNEK